MTNDTKIVIRYSNDGNRRDRCSIFQWRITNSSSFVIRLVNIAVFEYRITNSSLFVIQMYLLQCLNDEWHKNRYSLFKWRKPKRSLFDIPMTNNKQLVIRYSTCKYCSVWISNNKQLVICYSNVLVAVLEWRMTQTSLFVIQMTESEELVIRYSNDE